MAKAGRKSVYKPEYCDLLIKHMSTGHSFKSFGAIIGVVRATLYNWVDVYPEFKEAKELATDKSLLFWEKVGIEGLWTETIRKSDGSSVTRSLNTGVYVFSMKNHHKWNDKVEPEGEGEKPIKTAFSFKDLIKK